MQQIVQYFVLGNEEQAEEAAAVFDVDGRSAADSSDAEQQALASVIPAAPKNKKVSKDKSNRCKNTKATQQVDQMGWEFEGVRFKNCKVSHEIYERKCPKAAIGVIITVVE